MSDYNLNNEHDNIFLINFSKIDNRLDPHPYHLERMQAISKLENITHKKLKNFVSFKKVQTNIIENDDIYIGLENIESNTGEYIEKNAKTSISSANIFTKGQILFPKLRPYLNKVYFAEFDGLCSTEFHVLSAHNISDEYLSIFLRTSLVVHQTKHLMTGNTLPRLQTEDVKNILIANPSSEIQERIIDINREAYSKRQEKQQQVIDFLDSIDNYLLNELDIELPYTIHTLKDRMFEISFSELDSRQDPFFYLKEFQDIEHSIEDSQWSVYALKDIFEINRGGSPRPIHNYYTEDEDGLNWIRIGDTKNNTKYITETSKKIKPSGAQYSRKVIPNDFLLSNSMSFGRPYIMKIEGYIHDGWLLFRPKTHLVNQDFLHSLLSSKLIYKLFSKATIGGVVENLNIDLVKNIRIPLPPLEKQNEIAEHISEIRQTAQRLEQEAQDVIENAKAEVERMILGQ